MDGWMDGCIITASCRSCFASIKRHSPKRRVGAADGISRTRPGRSSVSFQPQTRPQDPLLTLPSKAAAPAGYLQGSGLCLG